MFVKFDGGLLETHKRIEWGWGLIFFVIHLFSFEKVLTLYQVNCENLFFILKEFL